VESPLDPAPLGTATHNLFEDLIARSMGERGLAAAATLLADLEVHHRDLGAPTAPDDLARWRNEVQRRMVGLWEIENPDEIDIVSSELHVNVDLDGIKP